MSALVFAAVFAALYAAHQVGDHWPSTNRGALYKGMRRADALAAGLHRHTGPRACAMHVASYTATGVLFLAALVWRTGLDVDLWRTLAGLTVSALTHYWADRRYTLKWLCDRLAWIGKDRFYALGAPRPGHDDNPTIGTGAYLLDQSFHIFWLFIAALIVS